MIGAVCATYFGAFGAGLTPNDPTYRRTFQAFFTTGFLLLLVTTRWTVRYYNVPDRTAVRDRLLISPRQLYVVGILFGGFVAVTIPAEIATTTFGRVVSAILAAPVPVAAIQGYQLHRRLGPADG